MKIMKKIFILILVLTICLLGYVLNLSAIGINDSNCIIVYITDENINDFYNKNIKKVNKNEMKSLENNESKYIIVDDNMLNDINTKVVLNNAFINGKKIFIMSRNLSRNEIRQYFGLEQKEYPENKEIVQNKNHSSDNMVNVSKFDSIGMLIYGDELGTNVTNVKVEKSDDKESIYNAIEYAFNYNYLKLALNKEIKKEALFTTSKVYATYKSSWTNVNLDTWTYVTARCVINTSLKIEKNDGPNYDDEYLFYVPYIVEVSMNELFSVDEADVEVKGKAGSIVYDYGPTPISGVKSIFFSFPFNTSVNFSVGDKVNISKTSGGINSNNTKLKYDIRGFLGLDSSGKLLRSETHIESYQTSSFFEGYGQFHVRTREINFSDPITYYNDWDSVGGSS